MKKSLLTVVLMSMVSCISWFLGKETAEIKMQQKIEQIELQHTEELNDLNNQIEQYEEKIKESQDNIYSLQNEIETEEQQETCQNSTSNYDSDNDGDDQYDNEYADPDDVYTDENGIIIYDKYGTNRYQSNNENKSTGYGNYFIARGNSYYHNSSSCKFLEGAETERVTEDQAISRGKHQCNCIKYGY